MILFQVRHVRFVDGQIIDSPFGEQFATKAQAQLIVDDFNSSINRKAIQSQKCDKCPLSITYVFNTEWVIGNNEIKQLLPDTDCCSCYSPIQLEFKPKDIEGELLYEVLCNNAARIEDPTEHMYVNQVIM